MRFENFFTYYKKQLNTRQDQVKQAILTGANDWAEYRYLTGKKFLRRVGLGLYYFP